MKQRHWDRIENVTKCKFEPFSENFLLRNIMEAPLLENKDDLEDICISSGRFPNPSSVLKKGERISDWLKGQPIGIDWKPFLSQGK